MAMMPFVPFVPLTWHDLFRVIASMTPARVVVDYRGRAEYPDEWAHQLRHYKPNERDRYGIAQAGSVLFVHAICPDTGRFLSKHPAWVVRPAPQAIALETGRNDAFSWLLSDDDRMTVLKDGARLVIRLFPNPYQGGRLDPVVVYKDGEWSMEAESRAFHLADRIAERLTNERARRVVTGFEHLPANISETDDKGLAA